MVGKEIAVKKYVVRLGAEERARLDELIRKGKRSAQLLTKARILLKSDVSELGEGWSDSRIAAALDTSIATIERTRRQLVEEGFEAVLRRKYNPNSARPRIFDGVAEAKLIALTLSPAPEGFARWSLRLLVTSGVNCTQNQRFEFPYNVGSVSSPIRLRMPPCSGQSRPSPAGGREDAASLDRPCARRLRDLAVGMEECSRRGSNQRMALQKNKQTDNFKPVVLSEFQAAVDNARVAAAA